MERIWGEIIGASYRLPIDEDELTEIDFEMLQRGIEAIVNPSIYITEWDNEAKWNQVGLPIRRK